MSDSKSSICMFCSKEFSSEGELKTHYQSMHKENKYKFKCDHCDKQFRFATGLSRHQLTHSVNHFKESKVKGEIKTNKIKKCINTCVVKRGGLRIRPFAAISIKKKKTKNAETMDESIDEFGIKKGESKTKEDIPRGINENQKSSINGEIMDHSEEINCREDELYYEEMMDDSEVIYDSQEEPKNGEILNHSDEISVISVESKNEEMVDNSVETITVPDESTIEETVLGSEGIGNMSKTCKNEVTMVDSEEIAAMSEDSINGEITVTSKDISVMPEGSVSGETLVDFEEIDVISKELKDEKRINDSEELYIKPDEAINEEMSVDSEEIDIISEESKEGNMMDGSNEINILADESISEEMSVDSKEIVDMSEDSINLSGKNNVTQKESNNVEAENYPRKEITVKRQQTAEEIEKEIFG